ncbi:hypothetical protein Bca101_085524 [Brassica carinata]
MKLKWVGRAVRARPEGDVASRYWAMKTKKGQWFQLREIEIENRKKRARWRRTEALNRRSIFSKRKRRPDLLTPHALSLPPSLAACLCKSKGRSFQSKGRSFEISIHFRSIPVMYASFFPLQILGESSQSWQVK